MSESLISDTFTDSEFNKEVLVITVRKNFWATLDSDIFPRRIYASTIFGLSGSWLNSILTTCRALLAIWRRRPKLLLFGLGSRYIPWLVMLKRLGLIGDIVFVVSNYKIREKDLPYVDRILVYSSSRVKRWIPAVQKKCSVIPLPAVKASPQHPAHITKCPNPYIFTGGWGSRDYHTLIRAVKGLDIDLVIVSYEPDRLKKSIELPENCRIYGLMPREHFMGLMKESLLVAVPLERGAYSHGHTTIVEALSLGKALLSTLGGSVDDYIVNEKEGLLVQAGEVDAYRGAILRLWHDSNLRLSCEHYARLRAADFTYEAYVRRIHRFYEQARPTRTRDSGLAHSSEPQPLSDVTV